MGQIARWPVVRLARWSVAVAALQSLSLYILAQILPGFAVGDAESVFVAAVSITGSLALGWPLLYAISARIHPLLFPGLTYALAGALVLSISNMVDSIGFDGLVVRGIGTGALVAAGLTALNVLLGGLFSLADGDAYQWFAVRPLRRKYRHADRSDEPGILFLEIDGLSAPVLRKALDEGYMPNVQRWLASGSHALRRWEPDLSSQTSASQAGILLGDNTGIPAFRWYEKATHTLMVSSRASVARELERRLGGQDGLLEPDGASRWNVFTGGATDALCTYSDLNVRSGSSSYLAYFFNPYTLPRSFVLFLADIVRERWQAWRQRAAREEPRIRRTWKYAVVRAATTTLMLEATLFMLLSDMFRGLPAVYTTIFAYDEVAHHSGIDRSDALKVLTRIDRVIGVLEGARTHAARPYRLVVLSDHGQSMGPPFRQAHGESLGDLVARLVGPGRRVSVDLRETEDWGHLNMVLTQAIQAGQGSRSATLLQRALSQRMAGGEVALGDAATDIVKDREADASDVVVLGSGNLGLISFPSLPGRASYEILLDREPELIPGLIAHDGIGFIMVSSENDGALAIGAGGLHYLERDVVVGDDPLAGYGENAVRHLLRTSGFPNAPDILVMSTVDAESGAVSAFEELVGSHGGLGGSQTQPILIHPTELDAGTDPIIGAGALHTVLKGWRNAAPGRSRA
jgi:uncharacterized membrane protein YvlD (DUF360 family)